jgi:GNAT superfamily N-acetyltransferase
MTQQNLLELAKQGNAKAIATLLQRSIPLQGITVKAGIKQNCLMVFLESDEVTEEQLLAEFIKKEVNKLALEFIRIVKIYARQKRNNYPDWIKEFDVEASVKIPLPPGFILRQATLKDRFKAFKLILKSSVFDVANRWVKIVEQLLISLILYLVIEIVIEIVIFQNQSIEIIQFIIEYFINFPYLIIGLSFFLIILYMIIYMIILKQYISHFWVIEYQSSLVGLGSLHKTSWRNINIKTIVILILIILVSLILGLGSFLFFSARITPYNDTISSVFMSAALFLIGAGISILFYLIFKVFIDYVLPFFNPRIKLNRSHEETKIGLLFVTANYRRRGLGSALVKRLIQEVTLPLYVHSIPDAVSFYTRLGFVPLRSYKKGFFTNFVPLVYNNDSRASSTKI